MCSLKGTYNISQTIPIDILVKPKVMENILMGMNCTTNGITTYTTLFK